MLKKRLIPVLLLQDGLLVRSELFHTHQIIGNPIHEVERFNEWGVDELIYLDIGRQDNYDLGRNDKKVKGLSDQLQILEEVSKTCFVPLTWGGRIRTIEDMRHRFSLGADKITINSQAVRTPDIITDSARVFGSQAIVVSIDAKWSPEIGRHEVMIDGGATPAGVGVVEWARRVAELGAGEILLQSIDRDGTGLGYDVELISEVASNVLVPVIACSGAGRYEDYAKAIEAGASAVAAANIWHFKEMADRGGKRAMIRAGIDVRTPTLGDVI